MLLRFLIICVSFLITPFVWAAADCEMRLSNQGFKSLSSDVVFYHRQLMAAHAKFARVSSMVRWTDPHGHSARMTAYYAQLNPNSVSLPILTEGSRVQIQSEASKVSGENINSLTELTLARELGLAPRIDLVYEAPSTSLYDPASELTIFNLILAANMGTRSDHLRIILRGESPGELKALQERLVAATDPEKRDRILLNLPAVHFYLRALPFAFAGYEVLEHRLVLNFLIHSDDEILENLLAPPKNAN